jgi:lipopolysaccharide biosynthesis regulator YciM
MAEEEIKDIEEMIRQREKAMWAVIERRLAEAEAHLKTAERGIRALKKAGEDTTKMETELELAKQRLERLKKAFLSEKP